MRGEYSTALAAGSRNIGSPPHAWGIPAACLIDLSTIGITPTCVGNTLGDEAAAPGG